MRTESWDWLRSDNPEIKVNGGISHSLGLDEDNVRYFLRVEGSPSCFDPRFNLLGPILFRMEFQAKYRNCCGSLQNGIIASLS